MTLKKLFLGEDRDLSSVEVVLVMGITVILAVVIGLFVLNMGADSNSPPKTYWEMYSQDTTSPGSITEDRISLVHDGGAAITVSEFVVDIGGTEYALADFKTSTGSSLQSELKPGAKIRISASGYAGPGNVTNEFSGTTIHLVWENPDTGERHIVKSTTPK
ncbi:type IV pilin N-terminal domain-containing protein [Halorhabdus sp. BNX81]|uniref:type IV pilin N-terminal domain-containing protein n=2 Tax=unclassified Halorhabdus TaxID=2621901 RepID=UPI0023DD0594|nr:type IV pilin N-terminal domain-containing protein [Halorhabdus sp. BNX81]WEL22283.1 Pilin/Flagellin, FlaG/FlaF family [Halorhabdus sp. BNX81]